MISALCKIELERLGTVEVLLGIFDAEDLTLVNHLLLAITLFNYKCKLNGSHPKSTGFESKNQSDIQYDIEKVIAIIILKVGKNQNFLWYNLIVYSVKKSSSPLSVVVIVISFWVIGFCKVLSGENEPRLASILYLLTLLLDTVGT